MSFVKKAAKKVFKTVKKVVKKVWKPVLIAGAIAFTGGLATVGFGAFSGATTLGGFLGGVGNTMLAGAQAIGGSLGIGQGLSSTVAGATGSTAGTTLGSGVLAQSLGFGGPAANMGLNAAGVPNSIAATSNVSTSSLAGLGGQSAINAAATVTPSAGKGFLSAAMKAVGNFASTDAGRMMLFSGVSQGIQGYLANEQYEKEQKRRDRANFYGGPMIGGTTDTSMIQFPQFGNQPAGQVGPTPQVAAGPPQPQTPPGLLPQQMGVMTPGNLDLIGPEQQQPEIGMFDPMGGYV